MMLGSEVRRRARAREASGTRCAAERLLLEQVAHLWIVNNSERSETGSIS
jgi:hypothetical protein